MSKQVIVIGGGVSGLAVLHYLKQRSAGRRDVGCVLLEKNDCLGGTIGTQTAAGCLFEAGPNGFLDSKPETLNFIASLGLDKALVKAREQAKIRYISKRNVLYKIPTSPKDFLSFPLLSPFEKMRVLADFVIPSKSDPLESVFDFGARRLGRRFAEVFLDPMVSGIYGGDARQITLQAAFPRMFELEEKYGSLFRALLKSKKTKGAPSGKPAGMPMGTLTSFTAGMVQLVNAVGEKYRDDILLNEEVISVKRRDDKYHVRSRNREFTADYLFLCTPAGVAGQMVEDWNPLLAQDLKKIYYAPIAVVGLVYRKEQFSNPPAGFGYLIPSSEGKKVLGVLFDSEIFPGRSPADQVLLRVMVGGARHPEVLSINEDALIRLAVEEVRMTLKVQGAPLQTFKALWPRAIPQYHRAYVDAAGKIREQSATLKNFYLTANYLGGISFNDCIANAKKAVEEILL